MFSIDDQLSFLQEDSQNDEERSENVLLHQVEELKVVNKKLYDFALQEILQEDS
jgi:hypothetical protein